MTEQRTALRILSTLAVAISLGLLTACAPTSGGGGSDGGSSGGTDGGDSGSAAGCEIFDGTEAEPFTSSLITSAPDSGAVWGDGTKFAIQLSDEAVAAGLLPQVEFLTLANGGLQTATSQIFDEDGNGAYSNVNNLFADDLEGQPGIAQVFAISDASFDGAVNNGDSLIMGNYCVTFKN
jgi:hypothetical protein